MRVHSIGRTSFLLALSLLASVTQISVAKAGAPTREAMSGWTYVRSPNRGPEANFLKFVDASAQDDVWAVGYYSNGQGSNEQGSYRTLAQHWDGTRWTITHTPSPAFDSELYGVAAVSADDVWAVGWDGPDDSGDYTTFTSHWNGTEWSVVASPNERGDVNYLDAVTAIASDDVWAVGHYVNTDFDDEPLTMHWDGSSWSVVPLGGATYLAAVAASASNDVWTVGTDADPSGRHHAFFGHWDGISWSDFSPPHTSDASDVWDVSVVSPTDAWALGKNNDRAAFWHWDGTRWASHTADLPAEANVNRLVALSTSDVWAVGWLTTEILGEADTLVLHWNGTGWQRIPSPSPAVSSALWAVTAVSPTELWALGVASLQDFSPARTLTEHFTGS
jgi:hypothetical protein